MFDIKVILLSALVSFCLTVAFAPNSENGLIRKAFVIMVSPVWMLVAGSLSFVFASVRSFEFLKQGGSFYRAIDWLWVDFTLSLKCIVLQIKQNWHWTRKVKYKINIPDYSKATNFGSMLRHIRHALDIDLSEMAKDLGIGTAKLSSIEFGRATMSENQLSKIVDIYGLNAIQKIALVHLHATNKWL